MAIVDSFVRLAATVLETLHTRLELVSVEVEEELLRYSSYLLWVVVALFCAGVAILLGILLIVVIFWDSHREAVLLSMISVFAGVALYLGWWLRKSMRNKPRLLGFTLDELRRDTSALRSSNSSHTEE